MAYFDRRLTQAELTMPVDADGNFEGSDCEATCTLADGTTVTKDAPGVYTLTYLDGTVARVEQVGDVTYVGYRSPGLPLTRPLREHGGEAGDRLADAVEPALKAAVDWGYPDNDPLASPGTLERAGVLPSRTENQRFVRDFSAGVHAGLETLRPDTDAPTSRPARNLFRNALAQHREDTPADTRRPDSPRPKTLAAKRAVDKLSKAFTPQRLRAKSDSDGASADPKPSDGD